MLTKMTDVIFFWSAWIIIPLLFEIVPAICNFFLLLIMRVCTRKPKDLHFYPPVTLMIPVYNSASTLYRCIESIACSSYPEHLIEAILVDNGSADESFSIFEKAQIDFPSLPMWWIMSKQGKSRALNKAIFNSSGKYIINIDSDGILHKDAILNIVKRFERDNTTDCMTGVILTEPALVSATKSFCLRQFRKMEFLEYAQAFLAGRNFESHFNSIYTLSGAFSAFRKTTLQKTYLYNTNTICEDTHLTFQLKTVLKKKVKLCHDAVFFADPIESIDKFYTQRQRWQIGELEVSHMFMKNSLHSPIFGFFRNFAIRLLMMDHTFAFPRMIWYFALLALGCMNYSFHNIMAAVTLIYALYVLSAFLYYLNVISFLKDFPKVRRYYARKAGYLLFLPIYNLFSFFVRFAGIINSIRRKSSWRTKTLSEEGRTIKAAISRDFHFIIALRIFLKKVLEVPEQPARSSKKGRKEPRHAI